MSIAHRPLGASGLTVSTIGLGLNNLGRPGTVTAEQAGATALITAAIDAGVTLLDTADMYGAVPGQSESMLGEALGSRRDQVLIATKFGHSQVDVGIQGWGAKGSRRYIRLAVEASLRRLRTDWIDLYQLHTPDPITPIAETLAALDELVHDGKIRYFGHSNLAGWQIAEAELTARQLGTQHFISAQNEYNLLARGVEAEVLPAVRAMGIGFLPFFPLANGLLTGKFRQDGGPADTRIMRQRPHLIEAAPWPILEEYRRWCGDQGVSMLTATFGWLLAQPNLASVIAGATTPEQIVQNVEAVAAWQPTAEQVAHIGRLFAGR